MENVPQTGPVLVVINHLSNADIPALISVLAAPPDALREIELFELPILGN
jgi:1-acyl-sn-glycerol-3-phosphate acyltransferase